jgi:hypothetical protein
MSSTLVACWTGRSAARSRRERDDPGSVGVGEWMGGDDQAAVRPDGKPSNSRVDIRPAVDVDTDQLDSDRTSGCLRGPQESDIAAGIRAEQRDEFTPFHSITSSAP